MSYKLTCPGCKRYLSSIFRAYEDGRPCPQCGASLAPASEQFYRQLPDEHSEGEPMKTKVFDYAIGRDDENVEVHFTDGGRYDIPTAEWNAIVDAAQHQGRLTYQ